RRRGRREHHPQALPGFGQRQREDAARHRLHRRGGQDLPQERQPVDHPRRLRRRGAAGPAQDPRRHPVQCAAAGRAQASAPGVPADRHHQHPVHLRRRLRRPRGRHRAPAESEIPRFRSRHQGQARQEERPVPGERAARGPHQVRPDPRVRRPPAGGGDARGARRGGAGAHPPRAQEQPHPAVPDHPRIRRRGAEVLGRVAQGDRRRGVEAQRRRPRPAYHPRRADARSHVHNTLATRRQADPHQRGSRGEPHPADHALQEGRLRKGSGEVMPASYVTKKREVLPLVPLRDIVVFPHMMAPFIVGRESSVRALEQALSGSTKRIFLAAQKDPRIDDPLRDDICDIGVIASVIQNLKLPNGNVRVMVEGVQRGKIVAVVDTDGALNVEVETYEVNYPLSEELRTYMSKVLSAFEQYAKMSHHLAFEGLMSTLKLDDADRVADILSAHLMVATAEKQSLLELTNPYERLQRLHDLLDVEIEKINIDERIKAIHQELGRKDERGDELTELREKIDKAGLPKDVKEKAEQELKRLEAMPPVSAEATVSRNYIDWLVSVPW